MTKRGRQHRMVPSASSPDCVPIRFILAWLVPAMKPFQNLLQHDNVLCIVIEFDTRRVLDPDKGSLFGAIAETVPLTRTASFVGSKPPRIDWVGRPEQTNIRLNMPGSGPM